MLIDWFTVVAQLINFLILIWLLRRYLYRPVLRAVAAREARIAQETATARQATLDAQAELLRWQQKQDGWQQEHDDLLMQARAVAEAERASILQGAQQTAQQMQEAQRVALEAELRHLQHALQQQACEEVLRIVRQMVADLAQQELQSAMLTVFEQRVQQLDDRERKAWVTGQFVEQGVESSGAQDWVFRSAFALDAAQQQRVQDGLKTVFPDLPALHFEQVSELLCGIELQVGTHRLAWSARDYLQDFSLRVLALPQQIPPAQTTTQAQVAEALPEQK